VQSGTRFEEGLTETVDSQGYFAQIQVCCALSSAVAIHSLRNSYCEIHTVLAIKRATSRQIATSPRLQARQKQEGSLASGMRIGPNKGTVCTSKSAQHEPEKSLLGCLGQNHDMVVDFHSSAKPAKTATPC
jgi:hypothetical protein